MDMYNIRLATAKKDDGDKTDRSKREFFSKKKEKKEKGEKIVTNKQKIYQSLLKEISGSLKAVLLDENGKELKKIPVRELTDEIKKDTKVNAVVFDGIVTQRLLDIAKDKELTAVVGVKVGNVVKMPKSVKVFTKSDFQ